jgi:hypothetical protein
VRFSLIYAPTPYSAVSLLHPPAPTPIKIGFGAVRCGLVQCGFVVLLIVSLKLTLTPNNDDMMTNLLVQAKALNHATITMQTSLIV